MSTITGGISRWRGANALLRVADRHRQLELAQRRDGAARGVGDLDAGVEVHVGRAEMADRERVAGEVHGLEAVVHDELGAHRVVHARPEQVRLRLRAGAASASTDVSSGTRGRRSRRAESGLGASSGRCPFVRSFVSSCTLVIVVSLRSVALLVGVIPLAVVRDRCTRDARSPRAARTLRPAPSARRVIERDITKGKTCVHADVSFRQ